MCRRGIPAYFICVGVAACICWAFCIRLRRLRSPLGSVEAPPASAAAPDRNLDFWSTLKSFKEERSEILKPLWFLSELSHITSGLGLTLNSCDEKTWDEPRRREMDQKQQLYSMDQSLRRRCSADTEEVEASHAQLPKIVEKTLSQLPLLTESKREPFRRGSAHEYYASPTSDTNNNFCIPHQQTEPYMLEQTYHTEPSFYVNTSTSFFSDRFSVNPSPNHDQSFNNSSSYFPPLPSRSHSYTSAIPLPTRSPTSLPNPCISTDSATSTITYPARRHSYQKKNIITGAYVTGDITTDKQWRRHTRVFGGGMRISCEGEDTTRLILGEMRIPAIVVGKKNPLQDRRDLTRKASAGWVEEDRPSELVTLVEPVDGFGAVVH